MTLAALQAPFTLANSKAMIRTRHLPNRIATWLRELLGGDAAAGVLLILVAIVAIWVANSPLAHGYHDLFHGKLAWWPSLTPCICGSTMR